MIVSAYTATPNLYVNGMFGMLRVVRKLKEWLNPSRGSTVIDTAGPRKVWNPDGLQYQRKGYNEHDTFFAAIASMKSAT